MADINTNYLDGFQYVNAVLKFFPTAEGYVSDTFFDDAHHFNYVYQYKDHLGNVRLSYAWDKEYVKILEENNYYPYGLQHRNYNTDKSDFQKLPEEEQEGIYPTSTGDYGYRYNGKEWQDDLSVNMYDMDMRDYDPAIGRWVNIDPVIHYSQSTYNAFDGNPVVFADPSGGTSTRSGMFEFDGEGRHRYDSRGFFIPAFERLPADLEELEYLSSVFSLDGGSGGTRQLQGLDGVWHDVDESEFMSFEEVMAKTNNLENENPWDLDGDNKLSANEADNWWFNGNGQTITVDNSYINWVGLTMPNETKIGKQFSIQTHEAFLSLKYETAATYGGTMFERTGPLSAVVLDQPYHYDMRPNNSIINIIRNFLTEMGSPPGDYNKAQNYMIHFINPTIKFIIK